MGAHDAGTGAEGSSSGASSSVKKDSCLSSALQARNVQLLLLFACRLVQTVMRSAMGPLVVYICEDMPCGSNTKAWLLSAHAFGYCTTQIVGGYIADKAGGKTIIAASVTVAGLALVFTPLAQTTQQIAASQFIMGVAMGPLFPASIQFMSRWIPSAERGFAATALDTGITLGSMLAAPLSGLIAAPFGWRTAYLVYGFVAIAYAVLWQLVASLSPEQCSYCSEDERKFLAAAVPVKKVAADGKGSSGILLAFRHACLWAIYIAHFVFNYAIYFVNSWSATYYMEVFHMRPDEASMHLALPHASNFVVKVYGGPLVEKVLRRHRCSDLVCRRVNSGLGFVLPSIFLLFIPVTTSPYVATCFYTLALGSYGFHPSGFKANYMDVTMHNGGVISGIGNTVSSTASSMGPLVVDHLRHAYGSWVPAFHSVIFANMLAATVFCTLSQARPVELVEEEWQQRDAFGRPNKAPRLLQRLVQIVPLRRDRAE